MWGWDQMRAINSASNPYPTKQCAKMSPGGSKTLSEGNKIHDITRDLLYFLRSQ